MQDEVRQAAKEWIDTANKSNVEWMHTEMHDMTIGASYSTGPSTLAEDDDLWDALTSSRISVPLHKLLPLMPRFRDTLATLKFNDKSVAPPVNLNEPWMGPPLMDSQNSAVKIMIKGHDLHGCIIDGGSGVNVINKATYHNLGLNQWEPYPFWLRFHAKRPHVHPIGLIRHLDFTLGCHMFTISTVVLRLEVSGAYPMLLGRPWLRTANIKQHRQRNMISFRRGKTKVRLITEECLTTPHNTTPLYAEGVHMLDGLADEEPLGSHG